MTHKITLMANEIVEMDEFRLLCCETDEDGVLSIPTIDGFKDYEVTPNGLFKDNNYPWYYNEMQTALCKLMCAQIEKRKRKIKCL